MSDLKIKNWDESYERKENHIFYPQSEVVKFLNRFIKKRTGANEFKDILLAGGKKGQKLKALDFGCGIGRNVILCEEFEIEGYGVDISGEAIKKAKDFAAHFYPKRNDLQSRFQALKNEKLPFENDFFDFAISDCVLDSMYFEDAKKNLKELDRTVKKYLFISLISGSGVSKNYDKEEIVDTKHEKGTVQSYFNESKIKKLIADTKWKIKWISLVTEENLLEKSKNARFYLVLEK